MLVLIFFFYVWVYKWSLIYKMTRYTVWCCCSNTENIEPESQYANYLFKHVKFIQRLLCFMIVFIPCLFLIFNLVLLFDDPNYFYEGIVWYFKEIVKILTQKWKSVFIVLPSNPHDLLSSVELKKNKCWKKKSCIFSMQLQWSFKKKICKKAL